MNDTPKLCECGCGEAIEPKPHHRYRGTPRFKLGHHSRMPEISTGQRRSPCDPPNPSGLCMCGCGQSTPIATSSSRSRQQLIGHPTRYLPGHRSRMQPTGPAHPLWKGGRIMRRGWVMIHCPDHPNADSKGYYPEHRLVVEAAIGRYLESSEDVHHVNQVKDDNRLENLMVLTRAEHMQLHADERRLA